VAPKLYSGTEQPNVTSFVLIPQNDQSYFVFNVIDTPGLSESKKDKNLQRTDEQIIETIQTVLEKRNN